MRSGELAEATGVSTDTLRHYERLGVLQRPSRSASGYRQYPPEAVRRVLLIRRALAIGLSLRDLSVILKARDSGGTPCRQVRQLAAARLETVDRQLAELQAFRRQLKSILASWDATLAQTPEGSRANLLETLVDRPARKDSHNALKTSRGRAPR